MNRNRVIIAGGIIVLILIALFFWLGGDDASVGPVTGQQQPSVDGAAAPATGDSAQATGGDRPPAPAAGATVQGDAAGTDGPVAQDGDASSAQTGTGGAAQEPEVRQPAIASAVTAAADRSSEAGAAARQPTTGVLTDRRDASAPTAGQGDAGGAQATAGTERPAVEPAAAESAGTTRTAPAATGQVAEVTAAPDAVAAASGSRAERRPLEPQDSGRQSGSATAGQQKVAARPESPEETAALERQTRGGDGPAEGSRAPVPPGGNARPDSNRPDSNQTDSNQTGGSPADGAFPLPSFDIVRISQDCRAVIAGRAMPRALVVVSLGEDRLGEVMADRRGEWVLIPDQPLRPGPGEMRLSAMPQGGPAVPGRQGVIVSIPDCGKNDGKREAIIALRTDDREGRPSRILQLPGKTGSGGDLRLDTVDYDEAGKLILSGRAEPSTQVNVYANNAPVGQVHSDNEGRWSLLVDDKVPLGRQTLRLDQVGDRGAVKSRVEFPFSRASFRDLDLSDRSVIVQPGNSLWRIARRVYGEGPRFTVIYEANTEQIRNPDLIYPGQIFNLPEGAPAADRG